MRFRTHITFSTQLSSETHHVEIIVLKSTGFNKSYTQTYVSVLRKVLFCNDSGQIHPNKNKN